MVAWIGLILSILGLALGLLHALAADRAHGGSAHDGTWDALLARPMWPAPPRRALPLPSGDALGVTVLPR